MISNQNTSTAFFDSFHVKKQLKYSTRRMKDVDEGWIARAERLRAKIQRKSCKYPAFSRMPEVETVLRIALTVLSPAVQKARHYGSVPNGSQMRNYMQTMILSMSIICHATVSDLVG